jgi:glutaconate CoA-transferase subunit A
VTVEEIVDGNLLDDPALAAGTIPALYISRIAHAPGGMRPLGFGEEASDAVALATYAKAARTAEGFQHWLQGWLA